MKLHISDYSTLVFDCDGVVLNSNKVKTEAFRQAALPYGIEAADALVEYHVSNGGISRYSKFKFFLEEIVSQESSGPGLEALLASYAELAKKGLMECDVAAGLIELRNAYPYQRWLIVSGGDQVELREVFAERGLFKLFDGGIFGSPDDKDMILEREMGRGNIQHPALFLGDSKYDHRAATAKKLDFIFIKDWSEVPDKNEYICENKLVSIDGLDDLLLLL